ncbi:DUF4931 domain-containing protein [uncultured Tyzzerella sp.]|uniref:galactose-1-phosphate uridylyltransferase n=1 Tax=uncultured Tyzzerella sp. TaxID=2321398 RepID=UPI0029423177|nr:DUF4931 domain-containing protein [uncultured Tyzzerella sp.]
MIKKNFLTGEYVIYSLDRANRPQSIKKNTLKTPIEICPFCIENEHMTSNPIYTSFNKEIRIIDNKYPIIDINREKYGIHYVLIDTKEHQKNIVDYTDEHMYYLIKSMKDILNILEKDEKLEYVQIFKNKGANAGASQSHSHWQILALSMLPNRQKYMLDTLKEYEKDNGRCYFCSMDYTDNLVCENNEFLAFCPDDSLYCYEINIIPKKHITNIKYLDDYMLNELGSILKKCLIKLNLVYNDLDYNISVQNGFRAKYEYHFFIQIIPRMGYLGGFEFSTGMFVNSVLPKDAAKRLRKI